MRSIKNVNISIIGAARSGVAAAQLCKRYGGIPFVSDYGIPNEKYEAILIDERIAYEYGGHSEKVYDCQILVVSPGVKSDSHVVNIAKGINIEIVSELEFASWFFKGQIIAITGSNGKTTVTKMIESIFFATNKSFVVGGNIGRSFSSCVLKPSDVRYAILEVSSFQLDHIRTFRPNVAVITNISPDHLDRYANTYSKYLASKKRIYMNQTPEEYLVYNSDDCQAEQYISDANTTLVPCTTKSKLKYGGTYKDGSISIKTIYNSTKTTCDIRKLKVVGAHNHMNATMAAVAASLAGADPQSISSGLLNFNGVEHRLEYVKELLGVRWYNDSKSTNVDSTITALKSFNESVILIAGGRDKCAPYEPLKMYIEKTVKVMILLGEAASKMQNIFQEHTDVIRANSMSDAVQMAYAFAKSGDVVILSPACSSYDMYANYEERGHDYKQCVSLLS